MSCRKGLAWTSLRADNLGEVVSAGARCVRMWQRQTTRGTYGRFEEQQVSLQFRIVAHSHCGLCHPSSANLTPGGLQPGCPEVRASPHRQLGAASRRCRGCFQLMHGAGGERRTEVARTAQRSVQSPRPFHLRRGKIAPRRGHGRASPREVSAQGVPVGAWRLGRQPSERRSESTLVPKSAAQRDVSDAERCV